MLKDIIVRQYNFAVSFNMDQKDMGISWRCLYADSKILFEFDSFILKLALISTLLCLLLVLGAG